jgi:hypothetical protein
MARVRQRLLRWGAEPHAATLIAPTHAVRETLR